MAVIDDNNLEDFAQKGELTYAENEVGAPPPDSESTSTGQEDYWRDRALDLRRNWSETVEERQRLEDQAALLRRRFYSEDDPFVRDGKIKPDWDRVLDRISEAKQEEEAYRRELDAFYEQASLAGADPSWLDEGSELEPSISEEGPPSEQELPTHEIRNPPVGNENSP